MEGRGYMAQISKDKQKLVNEAVLSNSEKATEAIQKMREEIGIENRSLGGSLGNIERVKCEDAEYFPTPASFWKEESPLGYRLIADDCRDYLRCWTYKGLRVLVSAVKYNGWEWLHVSFSRPNRIPSYDEIQLVKENFFGDRKAIMVFPSKEHYVNVHKYCLHLWYSKDNPIPDFDIKMGILGPQI